VGGKSHRSWRQTYPTGFHRNQIPASNRKNSGWGDDLYVIRKYTFGVDVDDQEITLSAEHTEYRWLLFDEASTLLKFRNDRFALGELNQRIQRGDL
jgi:8-oxo-dGTP pyrophosphatase MutT (NUDIX family)